MRDDWSGDFDWDEGNRDKCLKHGVSRAEIEAVITEQRYFLPDMRHSADERRFITIGVGGAGRPVFVASTFRTVDDRLLVRPISARYMHREEVDDYAEAFPRLHERWGSRRIRRNR